MCVCVCVGVCFFREKRRDDTWSPSDSGAFDRGQKVHPGEDSSDPAEEHTQLIETHVCELVEVDSAADNRQTGPKHLQQRDDQDRIEFLKSRVPEI